MGDSLSPYLIGPSIFSGVPKTQDVSGADCVPVFRFCVVPLS